MAAVSVFLFCVRNFDDDNALEMREVGGDKRRGGGGGGGEGGGRERK
mgnify:CR=1 FL=1